MQDISFWKTMASKLNLDKSLIEKYKEEYNRTSCIFIPGLIPANVLVFLLKQLEQTSFEIKTEMDQEYKFGKVLFIPQESSVIFTFNMLFNDTGLFKSLQQITCCETIGNFNGRIHRSEDTDHEIDWHGDNADNRLLAMTVSLGYDEYSGAKFQLRKKNEEHIMREFGQIKAGDAFIFKIAPELEHRLTPLLSGKRTVGVGWFRSNSSM